MFGFCFVAELRTSIQEERRKAYQSKEVRTEFHTTLAEIEKWLSKAAQATTHNKDDTSSETAKAVRVCCLNLKQVIHG